MTSDLTKETPEGGHVSNATWLVRGMVGRECCRKLSAPCNPICKLMWRIWIVLLCLFLLASALINLGVSFWRFQPLEDHPDFFLAAKMKKMLILGPGLLPTFFGILNLGVIFASLWIMTMVFVPCFWMTILFGIVFRGFQTLLQLAIGLLLVLEVVYGWGEWPDDSYVSSLERLLMMELRKQDPGGGAVSTAWTNTQKLFGCCGVHSYQDWFIVPKNLHRNKSHPSSVLRTLPFSCCNGETEAEFCYEALSASWNERGCLEPQIQALKFNWLFLTISTALLFLSLSTITRALTSFWMKFPSTPSDPDAWIVMHQQYPKTGAISTSWEKHPPPPRKNRNRDPEDAEERKPLLETRSAPQVQGHRDGQGQRPISPQPSTTFLFKSSVGSHRSNPELTSAQRSEEFGQPGLANQSRSAGSRPLIPSPSQAEVPPQIYFPSRTPSKMSEESRGQVPSGIRDKLTEVGSNLSMLEELIPREGPEVKGDPSDDVFHTPKVSDTPMLLRD